MTYIEKAKALNDRINAAVDEVARLEKERAELNDFASNALTLDFKTKCFGGMRFRVYLATKTIEGEEILTRNTEIKSVGIICNDGWRVNVQLAENSTKNFETDGMLMYFNDIIRKFHNVQVPKGSK